MRKDIAWLLVTLLAAAGVGFFAPAGRPDTPRPAPAQRQTSVQREPRLYMRLPQGKGLVERREPWRSFEAERCQQRTAGP